MPIIIDNTLGARVKPESVAGLKNELANEAMAGLRQDIPGIEFGALPVQQPQPGGALPPAPEAEPQWQTLTFEPQAEPAPPPPVEAPAPKKERGFLHNLARKVGDRGGKLLWEMTGGLADTVGDYAPDWLNAGLVIDENGVRFATGDDYDSKSFVGTVADVMRDDERQVIEHRDTRTFEDVKASYKAGDVGKFAGDAAVFAIENGIASIPDMVGMLLAAPSYFSGLASEYTQERAANDGRAGQPTLKDAAYGTGTALIVGALEKYGADKVFDMFKGSKTRTRKWLEGIAAETFTEAVQNPAEFAGTRIDTQKQGEITTPAMLEQGAAGALGGLGAGTTIGGTVQGIGALRDRGARTPPPPAAPIPPATSTQAPAQKPAASPQGSVAQPAAANATPASGVAVIKPTPATPAPVAGLDAGNVTLYQPQGAKGPTPVRIESIAGRQAVVTSLDADGNPVLVDGEPATYVVQVTDLGAPKSTATPAAPQVPPAQAKAAAHPFDAEEKRATNPSAPTNAQGQPDAASAEPLKDIVAQIADMKDPATPRTGVFLSHANVKNLNGLKLLPKVKELGFPVVNFDYAGGLMLFPTKEAADAAIEARKGKKRADLQALIGQLTGAAVPAAPVKPDLTQPNVVVQQKTPDGAVARESLVPPDAAAATATAMAQPGRTVEVVTPEQAQVRRAEGVAADNAQASAVPPAAPAPEAKTPDPARAEQRKKLSKLPAGGSASLRQVMSFVEEQDKSAGPKQQGLEQRQQNAAMLAAGMKVPFSRAIAAGVLTDEEVAEGNRAIRAVSKLDEKSEYDTQKGKGTDHAKTTSKIKDLLKIGKTIADKLEAHEKQQEPVKDKAPASAKADEPAVAPKPTEKKDAPTPEAKTKDPEPPAPEADALPDELKEIAKRARAANARHELKITPQAIARQYDISFVDAKRVADSIKATEKAKAVARVKKDAPAIEPEKTATTVSIAPRKVEGKELKQLFTDIGWDPEEIVREAEAAGGSKRAGRGALARRIQEFLPDINKAGSWLQYMAGLRTTEALTEEQKHKIWKAALAFSRSDKPGPAMDALINTLMGLNLDGKMIQAVGEYANFLRAFNQLRERLDEIDAETEEQIDDERYGVEGYQNESETGYIDEYGDGRSSLPDAATRAAANQRMFRAWELASDSLRGLLQHLDGGVFSSRQVISNMLFAMRDVPGTEHFQRVLTRLRDLAPDVEVRFTHTIPPERGEGGASSALGKFFPTEGRVYVSSLQYPSEQLRTFLHEMVHAATFYELASSPNGTLRRGIVALREEATRLAEEHYGKERVQRTLDFYRGRGTGARADDHIDGLYGLLDDYEFVAEALTNSAFQENLAQLGAKKPVSYGEKLAGIVRKIYDTIIEWLGFQDAEANWLLKRAIEFTDMAMESQAERGRQTAATIDAAIDDFLKLEGGRTRAEAIDILSSAPPNTINKLGAMYRFDAKERRAAARGESLASREDFADVHERADLHEQSGRYLRTINTELTLLQDAAIAQQRGKEHVVQDHLERVASAIEAVLNKFTPPTQLRFAENSDLLDELLPRRAALERALASTRTGDIAGAVSALQGAASRRSLASYGDAPLRREANIRALAGSAATNVAKATRGALKSRAMETARKGNLGLWTFDQIERRLSRFFGSPGAHNPLTRLMDVRRRRQSHANVLLERAERDVNSKWMRLNKAQSTQLGQMMIDATLWSIDPSKPKDAQPAKVSKRKDFDRRYDKLQAQWKALSREQKEIFENARDFNTHMFNKIRRAAIDMALDSFAETVLAPAQKSLLYALRSPDQIDQLVGTGKLVDVGQMNEQFAKALKDVVRLTRVEGPYFSLRRYGDKVVEANKEGEETFASEADARARVEAIREMTPKNKATVKKVDGNYVVKYKLHYVSFHKSRGDAEADAERLRNAGFSVDAVTEKTTSVVSPALTPALKEMLSSAKRKLGTEGEGKAAIAFALENAFAQILAERAASLASEMKREGFAGVKAEEMHVGFAERTHSTAWHYANMLTAREEVQALTELRQYARDPDKGHVTDQNVMYERGLAVNEIERRMMIEAQEFGHNSPVDAALGKVAFANYLMTPSYTFVNSMQNFTVAMPVIGARYGYGRTSKAFARAMRAVAGPAFGKAFRGLATKPGGMTSYDIYTAIATALEADPKLAKWVKGDNSAIKQLVDLGVINASFTQELMSVAEGESRTVRKAMEYARLLPQGAEMFNRISTALAVLELTNGDVNKAADLVRLTQIDYSQANQPRLFRRIGRVSLPRSITMFKMYPQAIYNLLVSSTYDAVTGAGAPRAEAAKTLAGILVSHTVTAGVIGGLMLEPLRMLMWAINQVFGDDDEPYDPDTAVRNFMADIAGEKGGEILSRGIFNAVGLDLSSRLGINHLAFFQPPDFGNEDKTWRFVGQLLGPTVAMVVKNITQFNKKWEQGRPRDAVVGLVPIKLVQDTNKAWNMVNEGITTSSGMPIIAPEEVNAAQGAAKLLGFRTSQEATVQDRRSTKFNYEEWLSKRKTQLYTFYWNSQGEERQKAVADIKQFNEKNPGAAIKAGDLMRSRRMAKQQAAQARGEKIRNSDLRERMDF